MFDFGVNYEEINTLDYLIPPVTYKRKNVANVLTKKLTKTPNVQRQKDLYKKLTNVIIDTPNNIETEHRSTQSLVLKTITNKLLLEQYLILNITRKQALQRHFSTKVKNHKTVLSKNKPLIKITVEPNITGPQTSQVLVRRKRVTKKVQKTVSNTDSSTHDKKNNALITEIGEKSVHEIRATGSADLYRPKRFENNTKYDKIPSNQILYVKRLLKSLNMDNRYKRETNDRSHMGIQAFEKNDAIKDFKFTTRGCNCNDIKKENVLDDMNSRKNRVTISGRLGITENEQYILNCAATVDDRPIELRNEGQRAAPGTPNYNNQRFRKITQGTQATLNFCSDTVRNEKNDDITVQCNCKHTRDACTTVSHTEIGESEVPKSPLIVISVYPTKDSIENVKCFSDLVQINRMQISQNNSRDRLRKGKDKVNYSNVNKNVNKTLRSRSPSPPVKIAAKEKIQSRLNDQRATKTVKKESPDRQALLKQIRPQKDRTRNQIQSTAQYSKSVSVKKEQRGTKNAEQVKIKKALVDNYVQKFSIFANENDAKVYLETKAKHEPSRVTLNIDSDKEHYDVSFLQDKLNTDLTIRKSPTAHKTILSGGGKYDYEGIASEDSLENFFMLSKETSPRKKKKSMSQEKSLENHSASQRRGSGLKVRDSLEISRRRENSRCKNDINHDNGKVKKHKKSHFNETNASVKHYRGDKCSVPNPADRDKEIRELLGIERTRSGKLAFTQGTVPSQFGDQEPLHSLFQTKCEESNSYIFHQCNCISNNADLTKITKRRKMMSASTQYEEITVQQMETVPSQFVGQDTQHSLYQIKCEQCNSFIFQQCNCSWNDADLTKIANTRMVSTSTQYEQIAVQQMILNRNIQVFLQVEQFTKQKPIMLSRKQYNKVKKTIEKTVSKKLSQERRKRCNSKNSVISIGEIRKTRKQRIFNFKTKRTVQAKYEYMQAKQACFQNQGTQRTDSLGQNIPLVMLYTAEKDDNDKNNFKVSPRQTVSSMEIRYASIAHMKHVTFSTSNLGNYSPRVALCNLTDKRCPSIQTIFKGHKKSATPNLGTSAYSLYSDAETENLANKCALSPVNEKPRKPFLRRLMSCLVMRSTRVSKVKLPPQPMCKQPSLMSSFDSYHISTSLGAMELTSSLYDTSASFYSNHTIMPINRMKRGFFSSVRGFLTNRKSDK